MAAGILAYRDRSDSSSSASIRPHHPPYLGPKGGGNGWIPSRATPRSILWAVGDGANGGPDSRAVAAMVAANRVDRFLYLGDVYETGTASEYATRYRPVYGRFDAISAPTVGNHEWINVATGYVPYWTGVRGTPPPFWYAFAVSGWQLISLNSNLPAGEGSPQLDWLRSTIRRTPRYGNCRIAFMHHPRFSSGLHGDATTLDAAFRALSGHATIFLAGHNHDMERLRPVNGITQYVEGAGGDELKPVNPRDTRDAFVNDTQYGALRLKLQPGRAVLSFVAESGAVLDRSTVGCAQQ